MSNALYELYRSKVFELAKTMVIKFDPAAQAMNRELTALGISVSTDPKTWKYYLNLAGEYHPATDTVMQVESLDQLGTTIDFTKDNLAVNQLTASEYRYGTRFYNRLVQKYPEQEMLIRGILNPIDIDEAIAAENGTILYHDKSLVEENETNLIPDLEQWVKNVIARWHISDYTLTDDLYAAGFMGILFANLPQTIMNIRLKNCKTQRAHSYHIREYLESNGKLSKFIKYLTKKQALWLYRNIRYIHRNAGTRATFEMLVENILSERDLPIAEYDIRHNLSAILEDLQPTTVMRRTAINFRHIGSGSDVRDPSYILNKEAGLVFMDEEEILRQENDLETKLTRYMGNHLPTKVLESSVVDYTDSVSFPLADVLLNHWIYYAVQGSYQATIKVNNPVNAEIYFISVKDAVVLWMYCWLNGHLDDTNADFFTTIPEITVRNIRRLVDPTESNLLDVIDSSLVPQEVVDAALAVEYDHTPMSDTGAFYEACETIQAGMMKHREIHARQEHLLARSMVEGMVSQFYEDLELELETPGTAWTTWLNDRGIDLSGLQEDAFREMASSIVQEATGAGVNTSKELRNMHAAMVELMAQLSSYSVQFLTTINSSKTLISDIHPIRGGDWNSDAAVTAKAYVPQAVVQDIDAKASFIEESELQGENFTELLQAQGYDIIDMKDVLEMEMSVSGNFEQSTLVPIPIAGMLVQMEDTLDLDAIIQNNDLPDYTYPPEDYYPDGG